MIRSISILFLCGILSATAFPQLPEDVLVLGRSGTSQTLEFRPRFFTQQVPGSSGEKLVFHGFVGGIIPPTEQGRPLVPYRAVLVPVSGADVRIELVDVEYTDLQDAEPAPAPEYRIDGASLASPVFARKADRPSGFHPSLYAEVQSIRARGRESSALVHFYPIWYDEARRVLRRTDRIVVRVVSGSEASDRARRSVRLPDSPLSQGEWYKMDVSSPGIYKLDRALLSAAGIPPSAFSDIRSFRVFGNGGRPLPEDPTAPRPNGLREVARHVVDRNGNGVFDTDDAVLFYGAATRGWNYAAPSKTFSHFINHYTETNHYFVTFGGGPGKPMDSVTTAPSPSPFVPPDFLEKVFVEEERNNLINSGRQWFGQRFDSESRTAVYTTLLSGFVETKPTIYRMVLLGRSPSTESFQVQESGVNLGGSIPTVAIDVTSIENNYAYQTPVVTFSRTGPLSGDRSVLRFTFQASSAGAAGWLDWFEILYRRRFEVVNDALVFTSPDTTATIEYALSGFSSRDIHVFDVTVHDSVVRMANLVFDPLDPARCRFQSSQTAGSVRIFASAGPNGFLFPTNLRRIDNTNLQGITGGADYVIASPKEFRAEADRLKAHREQRDSVSVLVVNIEDVFNEYSGGLTDPMALRDFLFSATANWSTPPKYLLLFGDGHFDYKNIRTTSRNWIPPFETLESVHQILSYASDDHVGLLNPGDSRVSLAMGRLPLTSVVMARQAVDKIIAYEASSAFDSWRNRVTFVADDGLTSTRDEGNIHTFQAEVLAQSFTPAIVERKKVYIIEYPTVNSSSGRRKPTANAAIIDAVNEGTLILNYTGHGNPQLWAHEAIFTRETSLPQLKNKERPFLLVAATCDFARYDNPAEESAGELILTMAEGGAIAVVTASRAVYSFQNSQFNNTLYTEIFRRDTDGRPPRLGDVMLRTKQIHSSINDRKYHLFADPLMRLNLPESFARVDSVNGASLAAVVPINALSRISIEGAVNRPDGSPWTDFSGQALLEMFDSKRRVIIPEWGNYFFEVNGSLLYRGEISVRQGAFTATVPIPKDVSYDNNRARISIYAWSSSADAIGFTENLIIAGTDSTAVPDSVGPALQVYLEDESFRSGDVVAPDPLLLVRMFDQNGINTSTASVGHRLEALLSSQSQPIDLTNFYRGDLDTYQSGEVRYQLPSLPEGRHTLRVKAWDTYNNSAQEEVTFEVRAASDLRIYNLFNFPNPVSRSTVFTFQRTSDDPIDVEVKIYTLAGRLVKIQRSVSVIDRFVQIPWDGRDENGDPMANGTYFYKVITKSSASQRSQEQLGRLSIIR